MKRVRGLQAIFLLLRGHRRIREFIQQRGKAVSANSSLPPVARGLY
jgi:hypothetical protein